MSRRPRFAVVGAGIIGAAVARELMLRYPGSRVSLLEKEHAAAAHQTGYNSGVVHAGLYYEPGGLKARLCRRGGALLREFCRDRGLPFIECGKLVVALDCLEQRRLKHIFDRAVSNGVPGVRMLGPSGIREVEPNVVGVAALHSPATAIVNFGAITEAFVDDLKRLGGVVEFGKEVEWIDSRSDEPVVHTATGELIVDRVIVCAGSQSDRLARRSGGSRYPGIVPFFGQYFALEPAYRDILHGLVYPVPDPKYPFLGVHLTRRFDGEMLVGPNAFLSLSREGYRGLGLDVRDLGETLASPGFWRFASRNLPSAAREARTVASKKYFLRAAQEYVPALEGARATRLTRGIRAQAMTADGKLVDEFAIEHRSGVIFVRNAPSPGATSSMAIAEHVVQLLDDPYGSV